MDLDAPLRDDERLFAPKAYERPKSEHQNAFEPFRLPTNPKTNGESKKPKKKKTKTIVKDSEDKEKPKKEVKKKKSIKKKKKLDATYTSIDDSTPKKEKARKNLVDDILVLNDVPTSSFSSSLNRNQPHLQQLAANETLAVKYSITVNDLDHHKVGVNLRLKNNNSETVRKLEVNLLETDNVKLDNEYGSTQGNVVLPFELPARTSNMHTLHLNVKNLNMTQKLIASISYLFEDSLGQCTQETLRCKLEIRAVAFLNFATISR